MFRVKAMFYNFKGGFDQFNGFILGVPWVIINGFNFGFLWLGS